MSAQTLSGKELAGDIRRRAREQGRDLEQDGIRPVLAVLTRQVEYAVCR